MTAPLSEVPDLTTPPALLPGAIIAAFDFDGTISTCDSLKKFVLFAVGPRRYAGAALSILPFLPMVPFSRGARETAKRLFLRAALGGIETETLKKIAWRFQARLDTLVRPEMLERIQQHVCLGHTIVLVSASPSLYLSFWAERHAIPHVLATELDLRGKRFAGHWQSPNCWGPEKTRRLQAWWQQARPSSLYVYGDSRGDREMAALVGSMPVVGQAWIRGTDQTFFSLPDTSPVA